MTLDTIKQAIKEQSSISFEYNKAEKTPGKRIGNPHAIFIMRKKDESESTKVHIEQTGGVSDSGVEFPSFRMFDISELSNVEIINSKQKFTTSLKYNPIWDGYKFVIVKI